MEGTAFDGSIWVAAAPSIALGTRCLDSCMSVIYVHDAQHQPSKLLGLLGEQQLHLLNVCLLKFQTSGRPSVPLKAGSTKLSHQAC
jgi:hypothetical protein